MKEGMLTNYNTLCYFSRIISCNLLPWQKVVPICFAALKDILKTVLSLLLFYV